MATRIRTTARIWDRAKGDFITLQVHIDIDPEIIAAELAGKANSNKSKRSRSIKGGVVLHIASPIPA